MNAECSFSEDCKGRIQCTKSSWTLDSIMPSQFVMLNYNRMSGDGTSCELVETVGTIVMLLWSGTSVHRLKLV